MSNTFQQTLVTQLEISLPHLLYTVKHKTGTKPQIIVSKFHANFLKKDVKSVGIHWNSKHIL